MENIAIKKAKINGKGGMDITYIDSGGNEKTLKSQNQLDSFQTQAFFDLSPFITYFTEQKEDAQIDWSDLKENGNRTPYPTAVKGISFNIGDNGVKLILLGYRTLANESVIELNSPQLDLDTLQYDFKYYSDFSKKIDWLKYQIQRYVENAENQNVATQIDEVLNK